MNINKNHLWLMLGFAMLLRLISLSTYPLMDTTEARYGEMARLMVETGNWLTPQFDYGVPFWGKPPLFTWMSAVGINVFGLSEFAVRFPHWLAGLFTVSLIALFAKKSGLNALVAATVLATCGIFSIAAGAVMTDMALTLSMTMTMLGFYYCWLDQSDKAKTWGYLFFVGLACGLLAKGPVAIVITGIAVFPWLVLQHGFIGAFIEFKRRFPLVTGIVLMLAIALPWYFLAELATPGFIDYFIVGEHFKRFFVSGWEGDLYGSAHDQPRGMIWLFWLESALPWSVVLPILLWVRRKNESPIHASHKGLTSFLFLWLLSPLILFTMAGNILPAYILPGVPALGLLVASLVTDKDFRWLSGIAAVLPVLLMVAMLVLNLGKADEKSDRVIFNQISTDSPVFYVSKRPFSGQFYSNGKAKQLDSIEMLTGLNNYYLIGNANSVEPLMAKENLSCSTDFIANSKRTLYHCQVSYGRN
ncbi:glycosyltransferase family 39 protein [Vibrio sp. DW001]|uniref:ArnT family glycosyltransferase n=1 Tax=Vibrio sp. DW001 TaxID=2912315 RepID=UPI0023B0BECB|nr:glycosyltransferase family 39 protein [Vibrio sp. DW001]WED27197.1 glycosyltransferase family 39 protein [Vibrio sp. DW001]